MYNPSVDTPNQDPSNPHSNWYDGQHDVAGSRFDLQAPFTAFGSARFQVQPYPLLTGAAGHAEQYGRLSSTVWEFVNRHCQSPAFATFAPPFFGYRLPGNTLGSSTEGFRLHTLVKNAEITMLYWHGHQFNEGCHAGRAALRGRAIRPRGSTCSIGFPAVQRHRRDAESADLSAGRISGQRAAGAQDRSGMAGPHAVQHDRCGNQKRVWSTRTPSTRWSHSIWTGSTLPG